GRQGLLEGVLDALPDLAVEALARDDDHREDPALERVRAQAQPGAALLLHREDGPDVLVELLGVGAEELLARQRVERRHYRLVVVAAGHGLVELEDLPELAAQDRDRLDGRVLRLAREQADEAALADDLTGVAEDLDADVVHAPGPVDGRLC